MDKLYKNLGGKFGKLFDCKVIKNDSSYDLNITKRDLFNYLNIVRYNSLNEFTEFDTMWKNLIKCNNKIEKMD